jgi:hypothetical protein
MRKRNHHGHGVAGKLQQIKALLLPGERPAADILDNCNAVVGVDYSLSNLESHATPFESEIPLTGLRHGDQSMLSPQRVACQ